MKKLTIALLPIILFSFSATVFAAGQKPKTDVDSLKVKNQIKTQNKSEETQIRTRTEEGDKGQGDMIKTQTRQEKKLAEGDSAQVKEQNKVSTKNKGVDKKIRVSTEKGDKGKGTMEQERYRDEDGDGIADSTQAKEKIRTMKKDSKGEAMTPKDGAGVKKGDESTTEKSR